MSKLEECARALCAEAMSKRIATVDVRQRAIDECWPSYEGMARAVITALREPDAGMVEAGVESGWTRDGTHEAAKALHQVIIDAALATP